MVRSVALGVLRQAGLPLNGNAGQGRAGNSGRRRSRRGTSSCTARSSAPSANRSVAWPSSLAVAPAERTWPRSANGRPVPEKVGAALSSASPSKRAAPRAPSKRSRVVSGNAGAAASVCTAGSGVNSVFGANALPWSTKRTLLRVASSASTRMRPGPRSSGRVSRQLRSSSALRSRFTRASTSTARVIETRSSSRLCHANSKRSRPASTNGRCASAQAALSMRSPRSSTSGSSRSVSPTCSCSNAMWRPERSKTIFWISGRNQFQSNSATRASSANAASAHATRRRGTPGRGGAGAGGRAGGRESEVVATVAPMIRRAPPAHRRPMAHGAVGGTSPRPRPEAGLFERARRCGSSSGRSSAPLLSSWLPTTGPAGVAPQRGAEPAQQRAQPLGPRSARQALADAAQRQLRRRRRSARPGSARASRWRSGRRPAPARGRAG